jgi:acetoin utilization deacetylase AcuC-like enzyme
MEKCIIYFTDVKGDTTKHLENEKRIFYPIKLINEKLKNKIISSKSIYISKKNIKKIISLVYSNEYLDKVLETSYECLLNSYNKKDANIKIDGDNDTLFTPLTYESISHTIKILFKSATDIISNKINYSYLLIRPPGHHSSFDNSAGFCIINNCYILASILLKKFNKKGVLILDWDLHHGDGTQKLVKSNKDNNIYFISLHGYDGKFYPGTGNELENNNFVLNVPINKGTEDNVYIDKFDKKVIPYIEINKNNFEVIIVSNGLDAHKDDPMQYLKLTSNSYLHMTKYILSIGKKIIFVLEGGYSPEVIGNVSIDLINLLNKY